MTENSTGQIDDPILNARFNAGELRKKENLTLAEKLILASNEDRFSFTYKGVEIEVWAPTENDFKKFAEIYNSVMVSGEERTQEENDAVEYELYKVVSNICIDESITPDLLKSGMLGTSFILKLMNELKEYNSREIEEVTAVKGFRKNKRS